MIRIKRAYDPPAPEDGARYLVDRLWPRGVKKELLRIERWMKEASPSNELRKSFAHDPQHWQEFVTRYKDELEANPPAWQPLLEAARKGDITLVYVARDPQYNNAAALKSFLDQRL